MYAYIIRFRSRTWCRLSSSMPKGSAPGPGVRGGWILPHWQSCFHCPMWKVAWESHSKGRLDSEDRRKNSFATETFAVLAQAVFPRESKQATQAKTNGFDEMDMPSHQVPGGKFPTICFRGFCSLVTWCMDLPILTSLHFRLQSQQITLKQMPKEETWIRWEMGM